MNANKQKTIESFQLVKEHIYELEKEIQMLKQNYFELKRQMKKENNCQEETIVGAITGTKVHLDSCPFAKNIQPKNRISFQTMEKAQNNGYKPCECLKKL
ncbi:MAG: hypothetical protein ACOCQG_00155 [Candidatus Nanoarchaeia archaeon]